MTEQQSKNVAQFLNDKYEEWRLERKAKGGRYSQIAYADYLGVNQSTLSKYMSLAKHKPVEAMDGPILWSFYVRWGDEFMQAFRVDAEETARIQKAKKLKKGQGDG